MKEDCRYIAFFDLDGTILGVNSGKMLVHRAFKAGLLRKREIFTGIYLSLLHRFDLVNPSILIEKMARWVTGLPEKVMEELITAVFRKDLLTSIRPEIRSELTFHKKRNAGVVILSSALYPVCLQVARYLEMDDVVSSKLEIRNGRFTGYPSGGFCFGTEKLTRLNEYCTLKRCRPGDAYYYGDSISDLPVLGSVGFPICINPDKKLQRIAQKKGWEIRQWN